MAFLCVLWSRVFKKESLAEPGRRRPEGQTSPQARGEVAARMTCIEDALLQKRDIIGFLNLHDQNRLRRLRNNRLSLDRRESLASLDSELNFTI